MSEYHVDQEDTVLAYVRLKSGERPFNRYGEGAGFARQAAKGKSAKGKPTYADNVVIDLAAERAKRAKRAK
ncbi:hypothetical protein [Dongia deserti]|uniref:hypothetical protein n=1 Tax=Dongia deserti TaxID=2268030 RepID=UPI000E64AB06|nr:hypothetical protein [Dongia deserti]